MPAARITLSIEQILTHGLSDPNEIPVLLGTCTGQATGELADVATVYSYTSVRAAVSALTAGGATPSGTIIDDLRRIEARPRAATERVFIVRIADVSASGDTANVAAVDAMDTIPAVHNVRPSFISLPALAPSIRRDPVISEAETVAQHFDAVVFAQSPYFAPVAASGPNPAKDSLQQAIEWGELNRHDRVAVLGNGYGATDDFKASSAATVGAFIEEDKRLGTRGWVPTGTRISIPTSPVPSGSYEISGTLRATATNTRLNDANMLAVVQSPDGLILSGNTLNTDPTATDIINEIVSRRITDQVIEMIARRLRRLTYYFNQPSSARLIAGSVAGELSLLQSRARGALTTAEFVHVPERDTPQGPAFDCTLIFARAITESAVRILIGG